MNDRPVKQPTDLSHIPHTQWQTLRVLPSGAFEIMEMREFPNTCLPTEYFNQQTQQWEIIY